MIHHNETGGRIPRVHLVSSEFPPVVRGGVERARVVPPVNEVAQWYHDSASDSLPPATVALDRPFVLATGRISKQKCYRYLFAAIKRLRRATIFVLRAGSPRQLYSKAALHVSPAIYEPFGRCNVESLLCGTPVCATAVGGTTEVKGASAILLPGPVECAEEFVDRLAEVLESVPDDQLHEQVRAPSLRVALSRSDWGRVLPRMLQIYREAAAYG